MGHVLLAGPGSPGSGALSLRLGAVSATMELLMGFVGWIAMRYSRTCLDGEASEGAFHGLTLASLATVLVLILTAPMVVASWISLQYYDENLEHEPRRLTVMNEAPEQAIADILARHDGVRALFDNGWLHLFSLAEGRVTSRYRPGAGWERAAPEPGAG